MKFQTYSENGVLFSIGLTSRRIEVHLAFQQDGGTQHVVAHVENLLAGNHFLHVSPLEILFAWLLERSD